MASRRAVSARSRRKTPSPDLFLALDHRVNEAAASIGQLCSVDQCEQLAGKLGKFPLDVVTGGLDQVLFRPSTEVNDDAKVKVVGRLRELGTIESHKFLQDVQKRAQAAGMSGRVRQAIDQAVLATSGVREMSRLRPTLFSARRSDGADFSLGAGTMACAGDASRPSLFSTNWLDDQGKSIDEVRAKLHGAKPTGNADLVVAVAGPRADKLIGAPLNGRANVDVRACARCAADHRGRRGRRLRCRRGLRALDASTGKKMRARPTGGLPAASARVTTARPRS